MSHKCRNHLRIPESYSSVEDVYQWLGDEDLFVYLECEKCGKEYRQHMNSTGIEKC